MKTVTINEFAKTCRDLLKSDRYVLGVCSGEMGEGKSNFTQQLARAVSRLTKIKFTFQDNMTFSRKELKEWIDGDKDGKGKKPEYTSLLPDELISMFFKRNWYDAEQIDGIELLNKCRDRHLLIVGNVPNFWDLDSAIYPLTTFWFHIHERGRCWVFQKDKNPFVSDKWHRKYNEKIFTQFGTPYKCKGFLCEIHFDDFAPEIKKEYYEIRNDKRRNVEKRAKSENYHKVKLQRDVLIKKLVKDHKEPVKDIATLIEMSKKQVYEVC